MTTVWAALIPAFQNKITAGVFKITQLTVQHHWKAFVENLGFWVQDQDISLAKRWSRPDVLPEQQYKWEWHDTSKDLEQKHSENSATQGGSWWELGFSSTT